MNRIVSHRMRVQTAMNISLFYGDLLGMNCVESEDGVKCEYSSPGCCLEFLPIATQPYTEKSVDQYWKIGITLRDLDIAVEYLKQQDVDVTEPRQFADIGYMCHLRDPNGFVIELLQQGFEGNAKDAPTGHPVGAQATLAHITLRVSDMQAAGYFFENELRMRLMSVQQVDEWGFCLYFYAWSNEPLPDADPASIANREWLWSRPYTLIELQHLQSPETVICRSHPLESGFDGFSIKESEADGQSLRIIRYEDIPV